MWGVHASHTDISHLFYTIACAKRHDVNAVADSACVVDIIGELLSQRLVDCVIKMFGITIKYK